MTTEYNESMDNDDLTLEIFLRDRIKEKGISLKKLSETSGVSINHIENMLRGDFERVPSTPYFRGYLLRLGEVLGFDGEWWWKKIRQQESVATSGATDALPRNRFARKSPAKIVGTIVLAVVIMIGIIVAFPHIIGEPSVSLISPQGNPYVTSSESIVLQGTAKNANSVSVNGDEAIIDGSGSWQKTVLLENGVNTFAISAQKFLGGTTNIVVHILYNAPVTASSSASSSPSSSSSASSSSPTTATTSGQ